MKIDPRVHQNPLLYKADGPFYSIVPLEERKLGKPEDATAAAEAQVAEVAALLNCPPERLRVQLLNHSMYLVVDGDSPTQQASAMVAREIAWYVAYLENTGNAEAAAALAGCAPVRGDVLLLPRKLLLPLFAKLVPALAA
jgi:hypothetical protein